MILVFFLPIKNYIERNLDKNVDIYLSTWWIWTVQRWPALLAVSLPETSGLTIFPLSWSCFSIPVHIWIKSVREGLLPVICSSKTYQNTNAKKLKDQMFFLWLMLCVHLVATVLKSFAGNEFHLNVKMSLLLYLISFVSMAPKFESHFLFDFAFKNTFSLSSQYGKISVVKCWCWRCTFDSLCSLN